ncbi:antitoxin Phd_YefM of type II toxin-antitoxin system [Palleronia aestuarii]|uniref:Antitoxin Phd_YefM of type II toxin-antitoxin system n=1 Tax=Palleronia aestuarii TaxID=568105 RepID=A0A2W7N358_9RHOB|nr:type II toxin-antitoxin system Phd/YefM family antitoxin [Palleronia aestuarii]PZX14498.1 antitoxin Phd_YefM of type II toxin-antitoxin system [Palleronia aestuarii]
MTKQVNISEAKAQLSALIAGIEASDERVMICRNGKVVAELSRPRAGTLVIGDLASKYRGAGPDIRGTDEDVLAEWGEA